MGFPQVVAGAVEGGFLGVVGFGRRPRARRFPPNAAGDRVVSSKVFVRWQAMACCRREGCTGDGVFIPSASGPNPIHTGSVVRLAVADQGV